MGKAQVTRLRTQNGKTDWSHKFEYLPLQYFPAKPEVGLGAVWSIAQKNWDSPDGYQYHYSYHSYTPRGYFRDSVGFPGSQCDCEHLQLCVRQVDADSASYGSGFDVVNTSFGTGAYLPMHTMRAIILSQIGLEQDWFGNCIDHARIIRSEWEQYKAKLDAFQPNDVLNRSGFSLPNFLLDIKDLLTIYPTIYKLVKETAPAIAKILRFRTLRDGLRQLTRLAAEGHLTYSFGILPLVGDIQRMLKILEKWRTWADLLCRQDRSQMYHWRIQPQRLAKEVWVSNWSPSITVEGVSFMYRVRRYPEFLAGNVQWKPWLPQIGETLSRVAQFMDALGVNWNPQIIWDKIPFTFVIDWFCNLGDTLAQYKLNTFSYGVELERVMASYKFIWEADIALAEFSGLPSTQMVLGDYDYSTGQWLSRNPGIIRTQLGSGYIRRHLDSGAHYVVNNASRYGINQFLLSASLTRTVGSSVYKKVKKLQPYGKEALIRLGLRDRYRELSDGSLYDELTKTLHRISKRKQTSQNLRWRYLAGLAGKPL